MTEKWHRIRLQVDVPRKVVDKIYQIVFKYSTLDMTTLEIEAPAEFKPYKKSKGNKQ